MYTPSEVNEIRMQAKHDASQQVHQLRKRVIDFCVALRGCRVSIEVEKLLNRFERDIAREQQ